MAASDKGYDVVYFLSCKPVKADGSDDPNGKWRSACVHFAQVNTITLNSGDAIQHGVDEMTFVTDGNKREWEGWMYDVSFCQRNKNANHFRCMIDPRGSSTGGPWKENEICGFSAKNIHGDKGQPERSKMIPVYKADGRKLIRIGSHDCYREYYATAAIAPKIGDTWENRNKGNISLWAKDGKIPPRGGNLRRRIAAGNDDREPGIDTEHALAPDSSDFVDVGDEPEDVEAPLDARGGGLQGEIDASSVPVLTDDDLKNSKVQSDSDYDHHKGDDSDRMYEDGEF